MPKKDRTDNKGSLLQMIRNIIIIMFILGIIYCFCPVEIVSMSGDSMHPTLPVGSVSVAIKVNENTNFQVGDIVTFAVEHNGTYYSRVTHRIVAIDGDTIQTKGDKHSVNDPFTIQKSQIRNIIKWKNVFKISK